MKFLEVAISGIWLILLLCSNTALAQTYADELAQHRKQYIKELLAEPRQPVKSNDAKFLRFFAPDTAYRVWATVQLTEGARPFLVPTHSGKQKPYKEFAALTFVIHDTICTLHVYQSVDLMGDKKYRNHLFLPFNDPTNYESTYAGGRYIDLDVSNIKDGMVLLDFNKCYNPYCAFADGFSCPIPPDENRLRVAIHAGEKMFAKFRQD